MSDYVDEDVRQQAAVRWIKQRLEQVGPAESDEAVMSDPSFEELYLAYAAHVNPALRWIRWRLAQEFPAWMRRYRRKGADGQFRVYYGGVRIKP